MNHSRRGLERGEEGAVGRIYYNGNRITRFKRRPMQRTAQGLARALDHGEFRLFFQPELNIASSTIASVEALLRWQHPKHGLLEPSVFIRLAEESGAIAHLGEWALTQACEQLAHWRSANACHEEMTMSVNVSPCQLRAGKTAQVVSELLSRIDIPPDRLCLEITESTVVENTSDCVDTLNELKSVGVRLALDDFGTGQSSLSSLGNYPVDLLKIDQSFMTGVASLKGRRVFAAAVGVAHALGLQAVAEGIRNERELEFVGSVGCDIAQGYHISAPLPEEEVAPLLRQSFGSDRDLEASLSSTVDSR